MTDHNCIILTKRCKQCGEELPLSKFYRERSMRDGHRNICKVCHAINHGYKPRELMPEGMKRCSKCHEMFPSTHECFHSRKNGNLNSVCKTCAKQTAHEWYYANTERAAQRNKQYAVNNADKLRNRAREYVKSHRLEANKRNQEYQKRYPDRNAAKTLRRTAEKHKLPHTFTIENWKRALIYWKDTCAYCGRPRGLWHTLAQDHFIPQRNGGGYTPDNILPACHGIDGCNNHKAASDPETWLISKFGKNKAKKILKSIKDYFASLG
jgi:hypothetical protein